MREAEVVVEKGSHLAEARDVVLMSNGEVVRDAEQPSVNAVNGRGRNEGRVHLLLVCYVCHLLIVIGFLVVMEGSAVCLPIPREVRLFSGRGGFQLLKARD